MLLLPSQPDQDRLASFALVVAIGAGVLVAAAARLLGLPAAIGAGLLAGVVVAAPGFLRPEGMLAPYRLWNRWARAYARAATGLLLRVWYVAVFVAVGRSVSKHGRVSEAGDATPRWLPHTTLEPALFSSEDEAPPGSAPGVGLRGVLSWSARTGRWWAAGLLPLLIALRVLDTREEPTLSSSNYTLY